MNDRPGSNTLNGPSHWNKAMSRKPTNRSEVMSAKCKLPCVVNGLPMLEVSPPSSRAPDGR